MIVLVFINAGNPTTACENNAISFLQLDSSGNILPVSSIGIYWRSVIRRRRMLIPC